MPLHNVWIRLGFLHKHSEEHLVMLTSNCYCCCTAAVVLSSREDWRWTSGARTWCHSLAMVVAGTFLLPLARISWASMAGSANWKSYFLNVRLNSFVRVLGQGVVCVLGGGVEKRAGLVPGSILLREANRRKKGLDYIFSSQSEEGASWRKFVIERRLLVHVFSPRRVTCWGRGELSFCFRRPQTFTIPYNRGIEIRCSRYYYYYFSSHNTFWPLDR